MDNIVIEKNSAKQPVLVIVGRRKRQFGDYIGEILKAEGINTFDRVEISSVKMELLSEYNVVILGETALTLYESSLFIGYVLNGGNLITIKPDEKIHSLFGITRTVGKLQDGYIKIDEAAEQLRGLSLDTMQYHGTADMYETEETQTLAHLYKDSVNQAGHPGLVIKSAGKGNAAAFAYNLPKSIVLTRQGNPKLAGTENDGIVSIKSGDLFVGWLDTDKNHINQADEQMRILSRLVELYTEECHPLPRLWYFPDVKKSLVIVTDDADFAAKEALDQHLKDVNSLGATMSVYLISPKIPKEVVDRWILSGNEIAGHTDNTSNAKYVYHSSMSEKFAETVEEHWKTYGLKIKTARNHWVLWCGEDEDGFPEFSAQAAIEAENGVELDCNYYHYDRNSPHGSFLGPPGNFTGSGLLMKFSDSHGNVLDIYQAVTQIPDEQWELGRMFHAFKVILDRSLDEEAYSFINANFHTQRWNRLKPEGMKILEYSHEKGIYTWAADRAVEFLRMREFAQFKDISWNVGKLEFKLDVPQKGKGLTFLVPYKHSGLYTAEIRVDGSLKRFENLKIKGRRYSALAVDGKAEYKVEVLYN